MTKLNDTQIKIVEKMLHILQTCRREEDEGVGYYQQDGKEVFFVGLCNLIRNLTIDTELIKSLYNYLPSYTGPRNSIGATYWFSSKGFEFFSDRIEFLEYVLKQNTNQKDI